MPSALDLTTVKNVKEYLNVKETTDDALLGRLVTAASQYIENFTHRSLKTASRSEVLDGNGASRILLRNYPITAVASLKIDGVAIPVATTVIANGYRFDQFSIILNGYSFTRGAQNIEITYTAGLTQIPEDLEQACVELVSLRYKEKTHLGEKSKNIAGANTTYSESELTAFAKAVLNDYKRVIPV